jgi:hypothetical protein
MKRWHTIFYARRAQCGLHKLRTGTRYAELVFSHLVGYVGQVVHSSASWALKVNTLLFILMWAR